MHPIGLVAGNEGPKKCRRDRANMHRPPCVPLLQRLVAASAGAPLPYPASSSGRTCCARRGQRKGRPTCISTWAGIGLVT